MAKKVTGFGQNSSWAVDFRLNMEPQYFQPGVTCTIHHAPYEVHFTTVLPPFVGVSGHQYAGFLSSRPIEKWEKHKQNESKYLLGGGNSDQAVLLGSSSLRKTSVYQPQNTGSSDLNCLGLLPQAGLWKWSDIMIQKNTPELMSQEEWPREEEAWLSLFVSSCHPRSFSTL